MGVRGVELDGRVALIAGASRGIGAATARRSAVAKVDVAVGYGHADEAAHPIARSKEPGEDWL